MKKKAKHIRSKISKKDFIEIIESMGFGLIYAGLFILFFIWKGAKKCKSTQEQLKFIWF